jgi:hypothetical protein
MGRLFTLVLLAGLSFEVLAAANAQSQFSSQPSMLDSTTALGDIPGLPAAPRGKSTILGGEISIIDPVRDELTLKVAGQHPVKILFDERTQAFIDGKRISLRQLGHADHASVQTLLDGTNVFALSIHILSQSPQGEYQGRVLNYDSSSNQLTISSPMFPQPQDSCACRDSGSTCRPDRICRDPPGNGRPGQGGNDFGHIQVKQRRPGRG